MEETISLKEMIKILRKHVMTIIISVLAGLAVASLATFFIISPKFSSQAQLIVTLPQSDTTNVNDVNTNLQMINTYKDMIVSDLVLNEVKDRLETQDKVTMSAEAIKKAISVNQSQNSQMFSIQAISPDPDVAQQVANTTANVFQIKAKDVMNVDKISIISDAVADGTPVSPNNKLNIAIGLALGLIIGVGIAFLLEVFDRTVKDESYLSEVLGFPILGTVPEMTMKDLNTIHPKKNTTVTQVKKMNDQARASRRKRSKV
jgi:capsular polysaccharide biosynthesis protein